MKIQACRHRGDEALHLASAALDLIVTTSVGPRVVSFRAAGRRSRNLLFEFPAREPRAHGLMLRGGHRLWHAPEHIVRTYAPDDDPLDVRRLPRGVSLVQPVEARTGLQKAIAIEFLGEKTVRLTHTLTNRGLWPVSCSPWAVTMLRCGYGVVPLLPKGSHEGGDLLPRYSIVPWSYTDLSLPMWHWRRDFIGIESRRAPVAQKFGLTAYPGWSACWLDGDVFVKFAPPRSGAAYPDLGCSFETFANGRFLEFETLGPLSTLEPGRSARHVEYWTVLPRRPKPDTDSVFRRSLEPAVRAWLRGLRRSA